MRWSAAWGLVLLLLVAPFGVLADAGRAAPECIEQPASSLPPTLAVDPGVCVTVDLGVLSPGDVYDFSIIVVDDAIDVLFFDQNSIPALRTRPIVPVGHGSTCQHGIRSGCA